MTSTVQIAMKGDENGCRLRQLCTFGEIIYRRDVNVTGVSQPTLKTSASHQLLFSTAQMDAFSLFQAIAAQVRKILIKKREDAVEGLYRKFFFFEREILKKIINVFNLEI